jgi:hypothetical protein|tara:strand:+ start:871 stop:1437 length:567 start_codon:yes stop_codon:yes gene_type:complete
MAREDVLHLDPFDASIPGQGMADAPQGNQWERPAKINKPDEALNYIVEKIEQNEEVHDAMVDLLASGTAIETLVNTASFAGFTEGMWTPDTAELIKIPLTMYFIGMAMENQIPAQLFNKDEREQESVLNGGDAQMIMKERRPEFHAMIQQAMNDEQEQRPDVLENDIEQSKQMMGVNDTSGFMPRREV